MAQARQARVMDFVVQAPGEKAGLVGPAESPVPRGSTVFVVLAEVSIHGHALLSNFEAHDRHAHGTGATLRRVVF